jgi:ribosome maturation factor RimP
MPALDKDELLAAVTSLCEESAVGTDIEIADVQLRGAGKARLLRIYIDKPGGVTHQDCELISSRLGKLLDEGDVIPGDEYTLEVSSPGVERALKKPRDFERVVGQKVKLSLREPVDGQLHLVGTLSGIAGDVLNLEITPDQSLQIPLEQIQKANLKFEW